MTMSFISLVLGTLCLIVTFRIILALYHYYIIRRKYDKIPKTYSLPFIGEALTLIQMTDIERRRWYESHVHQFKEGIFIHWMGMTPIIHIFKPEYLEVIFPSTVNIEKGIPYQLVRPWLGNGLLTSTGAQWFHDRRLIGPTFHFSILEKFAVIFSEKAEILIKCLEKEVEKHPGEAIDIFPFAINVALDIICETAMGVDIQAQEVGTEYCTTVRKTSVLTIQRSIRPWYSIDWLYYATADGKEYKRRLNQLHDFTKGVINRKKAVRRLQNDDAKQSSEEDENNLGKRKTKAFLDLLLDQNEIDDAPLNDDELRAQVDTFMFEGHDTTAVAITWVLFCLGSSLEHQEKVHQELEEVFKDSQAPASIKELSQLKYLDRVIKETLRLFPSVPTITRKLAEDVKLGDYNILKGTTVALAIFLAHRNPEVWPDALRFDPDRFLPENSKNRNPYAYVPFSAGPRNCIGQKFALLEEKVILTAILRKWKVKSLKTPNTLDFGGSLILRPYEKVFIHLTPKK